MAFIEKRRQQRSNGPGRVVWRARYRDPAGAERSQTFAKRSDAEKYLALVQADKLRGAWVDPRLARIRFEDWAARCLQTKTALKPKTRAGYESLLRTSLDRFAELPLSAIDTLAIRDWIAALHTSGLSPSRIRQAYRLLSSTMKAAVETGRLARTPCVGITLPRLPEREMRFLTPAEIRRLAESMPEPYDLFVYFLAYTGLRWGEAAALRRSRCQLARVRVEESLAEVSGTLHFGPTKTYAVRAVVLPSFLRDALALHLERRVPAAPDALVFTAPRGGPLRHANFRRSFWVPARRKAKLKGVRLHDLRHTCAALLISQGEHPKAMQAHLGHSSITVTLDRYGHLYPSDMEAMAERLETTFQNAAAESPAASLRPDAETEVVSLSGLGH